MIQADQQGIRPANVDVFLGVDVKRQVFLGVDMKIQCKWRDIHFMSLPGLTAGLNQLLYLLLWSETEGNQ